ncbi:MAG: OmpH family outer membrane protein [Ignavibacteriaceae bacterium]|nr:OmpH family outer membrane protein [Ignavibacteriaceae bacterium]
MKRYFLIFALFVFAASTFAQTPAVIKLGFVDSEIILKSLPEAIKAQGDLDALIQKWNAQLDSMGQTFQEAYANYQKQAATMKEAQKNEIQQKLVAQQQIVEEFRRSKFATGTGEVYQKQEEFLKPVKDKVLKTIETVAKEEGMQFVFDKTEQAAILLYADSAYEITFKVLDKLKRGK